MADFSEYGVPTQEWLAIEKTLPAKPEGLTPDQLKAIVNDLWEKTAAKAVIDEGLAPHFETKDFTITARDGASLPVRTYRPSGVPATQSLPVFLYFHMGGFCFGNLNTEDAVCGRLIKRATEKGQPLVVVSVNYRHTPEHQWPVAWNDSEDAFIWLHENITEIGGLSDQVVVGGISAGGTLTASLSLTQALGNNERIAALPKIKGQVLLIPCLVPPPYYEALLEKLRSPEVSSKVQCANAALLPVPLLDLFIGMLGLGNHTGSQDDRRLNPGLATGEQVKNLPPATFGVAGCDPLRDEGLLYSKLLAENGVPTDTYVFSGLPHGFRETGKLEANEMWDRVMSNGITWALSEPSAGAWEIKTK